MVSGCTEMKILRTQSSSPRSSSSQSIFLPSHILSLVIRSDTKSVASVSTDFGKLTLITPAAVLYPISIEDIIILVKLSYASSFPFGIAPRGRGHSVRGQASVSEDGVVVDMRSLSTQSRGGSRVMVSGCGRYADVGGEQLWIDVLKEGLKKGVAPVSWTDYLYITVGGTLSNGGTSGQTFKYGPQISNVLEMDVITGKGELVTCSEDKNSDLFFGVLGGLGQFGIIARARIILAPAPMRVRWTRILYVDFAAFRRDQEHLISRNDLDYLEGSLIFKQNPINNWRSSFFSDLDHTRIHSLATEYGIIYVLDVAKYYYDNISDDSNEDLEEAALGFEPRFRFSKEVSYFDFLNRVRSGEEELDSKGLWNVPHPWLNLFVPKSSISKFDSGVFRNILLKEETFTPIGPILIYPMNRNKWDDRTSAVVPEDGIFYMVALLHSATEKNWRVLDDQNDEILAFCEEENLGVKQYLPHYSKLGDWGNHFGAKWNTFQERKAKFDPRMILSPGQKIFNNAADA